MPIPGLMYASVAAPRATVPHGGLTSLARDETPGDLRWLSGYAYVPELPVASLRNRSFDGGVWGDDVGRPGEARQLVTTYPWTMELDLTVSTFQMNDEDVAATVSRAVDALTSHMLERELWLGEVVTADTPHRVLATADADDIGPSGGASMQRAVALLARAVGDAGMGDAAIHAPRDLGIMVPDGWKNADTLEDHGFVVISGTGYTGSGPGGTGTNWVYGTAMVNYRIEPMDILENGNNFFVRPTDNTVHIRAQRTGAVDFAGPVFACQVSES